VSYTNPPTLKPSGLASMSVTGEYVLKKIGYNSFALFKLRI